mgnify:FL=1
MSGDLNQSARRLGNLLDQGYLHRLEAEVLEKIAANRLLLDQINDLNEEIRVLKNKLSDATQDLSESPKVMAACGPYRGLA